MSCFGGGTTNSKDDAVTVRKRAWHYDELKKHDPNLHISKDTRYRIAGYIHPDDCALYPGIVAVYIPIQSLLERVSKDMLHMMLAKHGIHYFKRQARTVLGLVANFDNHDWTHCAQFVTLFEPCTSVQSGAERNRRYRANNANIQQSELERYHGRKKKT